MHRFVALCSVVAILLLGLVATRGEPTTAQEATADTMEAMAARAAHPVVGTWRFVSDFGEGPVVYYGIFHADGTYIGEAYVDGPMIFGVWEPTGARTAGLRFQHLYLWEERVAEADARQAITVDESGNTLEGQVVYVSRYIDDGALEYHFESTTMGTRVEMAPMVSRATLIRETGERATPVP
jgi:hypothetical protein